MSMFEGPVVYVDIETSGGSMATSRVIEVAALRVEAGEIIDTFSTLVNPGTAIPVWITNLTGITTSDVQSAPYFEDIAYQLQEILDGAIFIAHNVRFDYSYIKKELKACGYEYNPKLLCTVRLSRALYSEHKGHSLEKIIARHAIAVSARHRAYDDALAIKDFSELAYREKGAESFAIALQKQLKTQSLPPNLTETNLATIGHTPGVYVFEDREGAPLYVGKSVNLRSRILSHFNQDTKFSKEMQLSLGVHTVRTVETKTELEALLLESSMVKDLLPIHNRQLRRVKSHFVFLKDTDEQGYTTIHIADVDLSEQADLSHIYGMYTSRSKAKSALEEKRRTYQLCPKLLGLEHGKGACFMHQLGKCRGACVRKETPEAYNDRVEIALERSKVESWPFKSAIAMSEDEQDYIVLDNWIVLGYIHVEQEGEPDYRTIERRFDLDTYRILRSYLKAKRGKLKIVPFRPEMLSA
jgi:DNA polymerase-3 subunit epsilon